MCFTVICHDVTSSPEGRGGHRDTLTNTSKSPGSLFHLLCLPLLPSPPRPPCCLPPPIPLPTLTAPSCLSALLGSEGDPGTRLLRKRALHEGPQASEEMREGNRVDHAACLALQKPFCPQGRPRICSGRKASEILGTSGHRQGNWSKRPRGLGAGVLWSQGQGRR